VSNIDLVNAFIAPAQWIWEKEIGIALDMKNARAVGNTTTTEDVTAVIAFKGDVKGSVLYGFSLNTARTMIDCIMGEEVQNWDDVAGSALAELAQMITTRATAELAAARYKCQFSVPMVVEAIGQPLNVGVDQIQVSFVSQIGPLNVRFALDDATVVKDNDLLDWLRMRYK